MCKPSGHDPEAMHIYLGLWEDIQSFLELQVPTIFF